MTLKSKEHFWFHHKIREEEYVLQTHTHTNMSLMNFHSVLHTVLLRIALFCGGVGNFLLREMIQH